MVEEPKTESPSLPPERQMLAFFPWLELAHDVFFDGYRLVKYERGRLPGGAIQPALDSVLGPYLEGENRPVRGATILALKDRDLTAELTDDERADLFEVAELLAFAGLASRQYFQLVGMHYVNRETFTFIIQAFTDQSGGVAVTSRRRDGRTTTYVTGTQFRVRKPRTQDGVGRVDLELSLLAALLAARETVDWPDFGDSIFFFTQANTDSDQTSEQAELVFTVSAFERALDCRANEADLARRFLEEWRSGLLPSAECPRIPAEQQGRTVSDLWIRDAFRHRGGMAHGRRTSRHLALWSVDEHLLLGAYTFPLLMKLLLNRRGLYSLTEQDVGDIDVFEHLACARPFEATEEDGVPKYAWNEIRGAHAWNRAWRRIKEQMASDEPSVEETGSQEDQ